jgi:hypothetical protein
MTNPKNIIRYNPSNNKLVFVDPPKSLREGPTKPKTNKKSGRKLAQPVINPPVTLGTPIGLLLLLTR